MFVTFDLKRFLFRPHIAKLVCGGVGVLFVFQCISSFYDVATMRDMLRADSEKPSVKKQPNLSRLMPELNAQLFGEYISHPSGDLNIKRSMLNLQIVGILFSTNANDSKVIIRAANGQEETYKVGDELPGKAILKQISADGIVVLHDGELEQLSLPKRPLNFQPPPKAM